MERFGRDHLIDIGEANKEIEIPITRLVCGVKPKILDDLEEVLDYVDSQIVKLLASAHTGQEGNLLDFESKIFHAGMLDHLSLEVADVAQTSSFGSLNADFVEIGLGVIDKLKPVILVIGHNVSTAIYIMDYINEKKLLGKIEVGGICCTAFDASRYNSNIKIIGPISGYSRFIQSGVADVIVVDEQCIKIDALAEAQKIHTPLIAVSNEICFGLPDRTNDHVEEIVADLVNGKISGVLIQDPTRVGEVAVRTAMETAPKKNKYDILSEAEEISKKSKEIMINEEKFNICAGRGVIQDTEIRRVGGPIVLGEIPGVVAFVGCANHPNEGIEVAEMAKEFASRRFIVATSGCSAISIGMYRDESGKTLYETYPGGFEAGGIVNVGFFLANSHIAGAALKIASAFARRSLDGNYEEIADYVLNRVGAVGVAWGDFSQEAVTIASGFWRLGIPVIIGPHGSKCKFMLLGRKDKEDDWCVYDSRTGVKVNVGPVPEHLFYAAETKEEAIVMIAKLVMRANDTSKGRAIKLAHYIDLSQRLFGIMPDDVHLFVRNKADIPITLENEVLKILGKKEWKESVIPDPTLLEYMIRKKAT